MEQEEPTMEEILASIRQILSSEESTAPQSKEEPIVLDEQETPLNTPPSASCKDELEEPPAVVAQPAPDAPRQHVDVLPSSEAVITLTPEMLVVPEEEEKAPTIIDEEQTLEDEPTKESAAVQESVGSSSGISELSKETPVFEKETQTNNQDALTNLMAQLLKPALKEWMNAHMSEVLDKLVQEEMKNKS